MMPSAGIIRALSKKKQTILCGRLAKGRTE